MSALTDIAPTLLELREVVNSQALALAEAEARGAVDLDVYRRTLARARAVLETFEVPT